MLRDLANDDRCFALQQSCMGMHGTEKDGETERGVSDFSVLKYY